MHVRKAEPVQHHNRRRFRKTQHLHREGGLKFKRMFYQKGTHPFDEVEWELRSASITDEKGKVIFEQKDVETPRAGRRPPPISWSPNISTA